MEIKPLLIFGAFEVIPRQFKDERGYFTTTYDESRFASAGLSTKWVADNHSFNYKSGTLRGLHFQRPPFAQAKFVRVLSGRMFDVFVDLRPNSPSFLMWESIILTTDLNNGVYIPRGCAHGYLTLEDRSTVSYKVDSPYAPQSEGGLLWNDPKFKIAWPKAENKLISPKDQSWPQFDISLNPFG